MKLFFSFSLALFFSVSLFSFSMRVLSLLYPFVCVPLSLALFSTSLSVSPSLLIDLCLSLSLIVSFPLYLSLSPLFFSLYGFPLLPHSIPLSLSSIFHPF